MRRTRILWVVFTMMITALALGVALSVGVARATSLATADQYFTDPGGDAGAGTDITGVTVRNDTSGGISVQVGSANPVVANHAIAIFIDSDRNQATGSDGDEYWMYGGPLVGAAFFAWNGSTFVRTNPGTFQALIAAANVTEFRFNKADIGNVNGFNLAVVSISIDLAGDQLSIKSWDAAPNSGYYSYDLTTATTTTTKTTTTTQTTTTPTPVVAKPVISVPTATPASPVAGKRFAVSFTVTRSDTGGLLTAGKMVCDPSVGGKVIRHAESFKAGTAKLSFVVPKNAKGKLLKVKLTIKAGTQSATKVVTFKVK